MKGISPQNVVKSIGRDNNVDSFDIMGDNFSNASDDSLATISIHTPLKNKSQLPMFNDYDLFTFDAHAPTFSANSHRATEFNNNPHISGAIDTQEFFQADGPSAVDRWFNMKIALRDICDTPGPLRCASQTSVGCVTTIVLRHPLHAASLPTGTEAWNEVLRTTTLDMAQQIMEDQDWQATASGSDITAVTLLRNLVKLMPSYLACYHMILSDEALTLALESAGNTLRFITLDEQYVEQMMYSFVHFRVAGFYVIADDIHIKVALSNIGQHAKRLMIPLLLLDALQDIQDTNSILSPFARAFNRFETESFARVLDPSFPPGKEWVQGVIKALRQDHPKYGMYLYSVATKLNTTFYSGPSTVASFMKFTDKCALSTSTKRDVVPNVQTGKQGHMNHMVRSYSPQKPAATIQREIQLTTVGAIRYHSPRKPQIPKQRPSSTPSAMTLPLPASSKTSAVTKRTANDNLDVRKTTRFAQSSRPTSYPPGVHSNHDQFARLANTRASLPASTSAYSKPSSAGPNTNITARQSAGHSANARRTVSGASDFTIAE